MRCCQWPRPARGCTPRATSVATQTPSSRRSAALKLSANCGGVDLGPPSALPVLGGRGGAKVSHLSSGSLRPTVCVSSLGELRGGRRAVAHLIPLPLFGTPSFGVDRQGRGGGALSPKFILSNRRQSCCPGRALRPKYRGPKGPSRGIGWAEGRGRGPAGTNT